MSPEINRNQNPAIRFEKAHEVAGKARAPAMAPGYGRINSHCGALDYELGSGRYIMGYINRRDVADEIRAIPTLDIPSDETLVSFDQFMKGPPA
jgi:hypothetical protein